MLPTLLCTPAQPATLAPGSTLSCTGSHTITQADLDAGSVANTASSSATGVSSLTASATVNANVNKKLSLTKSASPATYSAVGDVINYTLAAKNDGNVTLSGVSISDPLLSALSCTPAQPATLAPGQTLTCTGSHSISQTDLNNGSFTNTATGSANGLTPVTASATVTSVGTKAISLVKTANPLTYSAINQVITYTYTITNSGTATLPGPFSVTDDKLGTINPCGSGPLAPGASTSCIKTYSIAQSDLNNGSITNKATASTTGATSNQATATVTAVQNGALTLAKGASPSTYSTVGQVITYTYTITNSGNLTVSGPFSVTDDKLGTFACSGSTSLAPAATASCTKTYTIKQSDLDAGSITNVATASGSTVTSAPATKTVTAVQTEHATLTKSANPSKYSTVGQIITYTITAKNDGNITLNGVSISDPMLPVLTCTPPQPATLAPTQTLTCTGTYTITAADIAAGSVKNTAAVNVTGPQAFSTTASVTITELLTAQLAPTTTTCAVFANGTASPFEGLQYSLKGKSISQVNPGVFFYYARYQAQSTSFTLNVTEGTGTWSRPVGIQSAILYDENCNKVNATVSTDAHGNVTYQMTGATIGKMYYVSVKYDPSTLIGYTPNGPTSNYTFGIPGTTITTTVTPKAK
jgi:uncharacterized repeat protein (TIGR01451 family)